MAVASCTTPTDSFPSVLSQTVGTEFELGDEGFALVPFSVSNVTSQTTYYLDACNERPSTAVDRREGGGWVGLYGGICIGRQQGPALKLGPGLRRQSVIAIHEPGVYRVRLGVSSGPGQRSEWSETSNSFVVR